MAGGCSGGPFPGKNATKARLHTAQVECGGIKVCGGVLDEYLSDAFATDLHRRSILVDYSGHWATGSTYAALNLVNESQSVLFTTQT